jgi:hypothetical protein
MGVEIIPDENDLLGVPEEVVRQVFEEPRVIHGGVAVRDLDMPPTFQRREQHEQIGRAIAPVLIIAVLWRKRETKAIDPG